MSPEPDFSRSSSIPCPISPFSTFHMWSEFLYRYGSKIALSFGTKAATGAAETRVNAKSPFWRATMASDSLFESVPPVRTSTMTRPSVLSSTSLANSSSARLVGYPFAWTSESLSITGRFATLASSFAQEPKNAERAAARTAAKTTFLITFTPS